MELKIFRDALPAAGASCTLKAELPLETEILISDYLPPVFKLVKCFVRPVVLQKQLQPGRLTLDGYLRCTVYYQGEDGAGLCQTEQKLPFTKTLELPEFPFTAWAAQVEGQTEYVNCRVVNPHRIEARGAFGLVVSVHAQNKTELITALSEGGIEQKFTTITGVRRAAVLEKLITVEGELALETAPAAVLDFSGTAEVRELKILRGKAVAKGEIKGQCAWRAEGETSLRSTSITLPFNQVLDAEGLSEDCRCLCVVEPTGFTLAQGEGDTSGPGTLTVTAMLRLRGWRPYQLQCVTDAFSTKFETTQTMQNILSERIVCPLSASATLKGSGALPDAGAKVLACFASFGPAQLAFQNGRWNLTARVEGTILERCTTACVESIALGEPLTPADPEISLRVYYAQAGEQLFEIARRFSVSPGQMLAANDKPHFIIIKNRHYRVLIESQRPGQPVPGRKLEDSVVRRSSPIADSGDKAVQSVVPVRCAVAGFSLPHWPFFAGLMGCLRALSRRRQQKSPHRAHSTGQRQQFAAGDSARRSRPA